MNKLFKYLLLPAFLAACSAPLKVSETRPVHYEMKLQKEDSLAVVVIDPYKKKLAGEMNTVIAQSDAALLREGLVSPLANFVLQAINNHAHKLYPQLGDHFISIINRGGMRINLPAGTITTGTIFELMPFDNAMVMLKIKGDKVKELIESFAQNGKLITWNTSFGISKKRAYDIKVDGKDVDEAADYTIIVSDYLANGGDDSFFFSSPVSYEASGVKLRDAIIDYCKDLSKENKHIVPYSDERIKSDK